MLEQHLDSLEFSGLIRLAQMEPEVEYLFRHALVQDVVYTSLLNRDRQQLHNAVGHALERLYPERLEFLSPVLGHHFDAAGDEQRACAYFIMAGNRALAAYANREAENHYRRALELTDVTPQQVLNATCRFLAEILLELGELTRAEQALREALEASGKSGGWNSVWPLCLLSALHARQGKTHLEAARGWLAQARAAASEQANVFDREKLLTAEARLACSEERWTEAMTAFAAAADLQAKMELRWYQARTLQEWAEACLASQQPDATEHARTLLDKALTLFEEMKVTHYAALVMDRLQTIG